MQRQMTDQVKGWETTLQGLQLGLEALAGRALPGLPLPYHVCMSELFCKMLCEHFSQSLQNHTLCVQLRNEFAKTAP